MREVICDQFLYFEHNKVNIYPGCKEEDYIIYITFNWKQEVISLHTGTKTSKNQVDIARMNPLDILYVKQSNFKYFLRPHYRYTKEVLDHVLNEGRISLEYYNNNVRS